MAVIGLAVIIISTMIFGRVYCSTLCPLGVLQDIIIRIGKKFNKRKRFGYQKPHYLFHYTLLAITVIFLLIDSMTLLNLFEPYSNFGRIAGNFGRPAILLINNQLSGLFNWLGIFFLYNIPIHTVNPGVLIFPAIFLLFLVYISHAHGRFFCNTLCPAGAILSLISRYSIFKIVIRDNVCNDCGACEKICKANCIKTDEHRIDYSSCINCYNCIKVCPKDGIKFSPFWKKESGVAMPLDPRRRTFFKETIPAALALGIPAYGVSAAITRYTVGTGDNNISPVTPPGSESFGHFTGHCTACHLCVTACPSQVLYPALLDYGFAGIFQPRMNYTHGYCGYDCIVCGSVCPTGAIMPLTIQQKKLTQIGKANFSRDECIVVKKKQDCGACSEHCPTKAVHMVPYEGHLSVPELSSEYCIGCGACEHACPVTPHKAIYVTANTVHQIAKKPIEKKIEKGFESSQDFPF